MKRVLALSIAILLTSTAAMAQYKFLSLGVKAGMNFSSATEFVKEVRAGSTMESRRDFVGGAFLELRPIRSFSLSGEVLYSGQGFINKGTTEDGDHFTADVKLSYLNVPVLANLYLFGSGLAVKAGVQFGFKACESLDIDFAGLNTDFSRTFKKADLAIPIGLSYNFRFGLILDARYTFGVTDISSNTANDVILGKTKGKIFTATIGYRF